MTTPWGNIFVFATTHHKCYNLNECLTKNSKKDTKGYTWRNTPPTQKTSWPKKSLPADNNTAPTTAPPHNNKHPHPNNREAQHAHHSPHNTHTHNPNHPAHTTPNNTTTHQPKTPNKKPNKQPSPASPQTPIPPSTTEISHKTKKNTHTYSNSHTNSNQQNAKSSDETKK